MTCVQYEQELFTLIDSRVADAGARLDSKNKASLSPLMDVFTGALS